MRTSEQRVEELHQRMNLRRKAKARRGRMIRVLILCVCLGISTLFSVWVSRVPEQSSHTMSNLPVASIFSDHAIGGYVAVALLAFCLGVLATILCLRLRKQGDGEEKPYDRKD